MPNVWETINDLVAQDLQRWASATRQKKSIDVSFKTIQYPLTYNNTFAGAERKKNEK